MDKKEKAKDEIRSKTQEMLLAIKVVKVAMDTGDEGGNLLIETLIEELQKMLPQQKRQNPPKPKIIIGPSVPEQYVGTELIQAEPAWRITDPSGYQYIQAKRAGSLRKVLRLCTVDATAWISVRLLKPPRMDRRSPAKAGTAGISM